jgi:hypothetical protein
MREGGRGAVWERDRSSEQIKYLMSRPRSDRMPENGGMGLNCDQAVMIRCGMHRCGARWAFYSPQRDVSGLTCSGESQRNC